ncbi:MAG: preprotein translocase subunit SecG [Bacteroidetes bacterium]|nr:preprotein translocase subunit SecG [Bacteroidota bacterium]
MALLLLILVILVSVLLGLVVLIQNPKGGGLSGSIAGFSNQFMGVKQTTDVLEKGTWIFAAIIAVLCLTSSFFMKGGSGGNEFIKEINTNQQTTSPSALPVQPAPQEVPQSLPSQDSSK